LPTPLPVEGTGEGKKPTMLSPFVGASGRQHRPDRHDIAASANPSIGHATSPLSFSAKRAIWGRLTSPATDIGPLFRLPQCPFLAASSREAPCRRGPVTWT
jgi:hypothetical protein